MAKLQPNRYWTKNGETKINGYKITLSKGDCEKAGFDETTTLKVENEKGVITISKEN